MIHCCKFCTRKLTPFRKRGKLEYHTIYARDPNVGYFVCVDCLDAIERSIKSIHDRKIHETVSEMTKSLHEHKKEETNSQ